MDEFVGFLLCFSKRIYLIYFSLSIRVLSPEQVFISLSDSWYPSMINMSVCFYWTRRCWGAGQPVPASPVHQRKLIHMPVVHSGFLSLNLAPARLSWRLCFSRWTLWWRDTVSCRSKFWLCTASSYRPGRTNRVSSPESERSSEWTHASRGQMWCTSSIYTDEDRDSWSSWRTSTPNSWDPSPNRTTTAELRLNSGSLIWNVLVLVVPHTRVWKYLRSRPLKECVCSKSQVM